MGLRLTVANQLSRKYDVDINRVIDLAHETMDRESFILYSMERDSDFDPGGAGAMAEFDQWKKELPENEQKVVNRIELMVMGGIAQAAAKSRKIEEFEKETRRLMEGGTPGYVPE